MQIEIVWGILIPFFGTAIGAGAVFFLRHGEREEGGGILAGFAGGIMVAASVWSLLLPAIDRSSHLGGGACIPAVLGVWSGMGMMWLSEKIVTRLERRLSGVRRLGKSSLLTVLAITVHNLPEGMAVGVAFSGCLSGDTGVVPVDAMMLALGIGIQNLPEGAIVSMPLLSQRRGKWQAFGIGVLSGVVEPVGAVLTMLLASFATPLLPYLLSLAAGAMLYVVIRELLPDVAIKHPNICILSFTFGFSLMMALDVALG